MTTYKTIQKIRRKKFKDKLCKICEGCSTKCNRENFERCQKCKECKQECLKYCDRYYCKIVFVAQATIKGKQVTLGTKRKEKEANQIKRKTLSDIDSGKYVEKNKMLLNSLLENFEKDKLDSNQIGDNSYNRNKCTINKINKLGLGSLKIQEITKEEVQKAINKIENESQSNIDKVYDELNAVFKNAVKNKIISENIIEKVTKPTSKKAKKVAVPFSLKEENQLIKYIEKDNIELHGNSKIDEVSMKNIIILSLLTGMRIGEIGAINYEEDINFENKYFEIRHTLTKEKDTNKVIIGETTKTGRVNRKNHKLDFRIVPFCVFNEKIIEKILQEQIKIAKENKHNTQNLLFCQKDGDYIKHSKITTAFKEICREAEVKQNLPKGCHIHMTKHTFVTRCIEAGIDLITISNIVGTTVRVLEKTYAHILLEFTVQELGKLNEYYKEKQIELNT